MKLTLKDRILISSLYPQESDLKTQVLVRDLNRKFELTQDEIREANLQVKGSQMTWDKPLEKDFDLTGLEVSFLKDRVKSFDEEKKITQENLDLCKKIQDLENDN